MGTTINPAVSRVSRSRWSLHVAIFAIAVAVGALVSFVAIYAVVAALRVGIGLMPTAAVGAAAIAYVSLRDLGAKVPVPYRRVQVPDWIRRVMPPSLTAFIYGSQLGTGFLTRFTNSTHFAFAIALPFLNDSWQVIAVIVAVAVSKTIVIVVSSVGPETGDFDEAINARFPWRPTGMKVLRLSNGVAAIAVAVSVVTLF